MSGERDQTDGTREADTEAEDTGSTEALIPDLPKGAAGMRHIGTLRGLRTRAEGARNPRGPWTRNPVTATHAPRTAKETAIGDRQ